MSIFASFMKCFTQGGQHGFHQYRMMGQVSWKLVQYGLALWCLLTLVVGWLLVGSEAMQNGVAMLLAMLYHGLGADNVQISLHYQSQLAKESVHDLLQEPYFVAQFYQTVACFERVVTGMALLILCFYGVAAYRLMKKGQRLTEERCLHGTQVVSEKKLARQVKKQWGVSDIFLDKLPLPKDFEVRHLLLHGTTGAGKSQAIMKLLKAIRRRGDKVIIPDAGGLLTAAFYRDGQDYLLSPMDQRSVNWSCWLEGDHWEDYHNIAQSLIPLSLREDPFWVSAARSIFSHGLEAMKTDVNRSHTKLLSLLLNAPLKDFSDYFSDTDAAMVANAETEKTTTCVRTLIATYLKSLRLVDRRFESICYGILTTDQLLTDPILLTLMEEKKLTLLLVVNPQRDGQPVVRGYQTPHGRLQPVTITKEAWATLQTDLKKLKLVATSHSAGSLQCLQGVEAAHRRWMKQLHEQIDVRSPFAADFSIRDWVADEQDSNWLFMPYAAHQRNAMRPLLSLWLDLACLHLLQRPVHPKQRLWLLLDELPTLHRLPSLETMAEARKFGGCFVLGVQSISQMWEIYGRQTTDTLLNLINTQLFFRSNASNVAQWSSQSLGEQTVTRCQEHLSYGVTPGRDGVSLHHQTVKQPAVTATDIQHLDDLEGYLRLSGDLPVTKIRLRYQSYRQRAEPFQPIIKDDIEQPIDQQLAHFSQLNLDPAQQVARTVSPVRRTQRDVAPTAESSNGQSKTKQANLEF